MPSFASPQTRRRRPGGDRDGQDPGPEDALDDFEFERAEALGAADAHDRVVMAWVVETGIPMRR